LAAVVRAHTGDTPAVEALAAGAADARTGAEQAQHLLVGALRDVDAFAIQYPEVRGAPDYLDLQVRLAGAQTLVGECTLAYQVDAARLNGRLRRRALRPAALLLRCSPAPAFDPVARVR
jgi:hypothetical protein